MPADLEKDPDYMAVIGMLLEATKAGKLDWQETADDNTFITAVKGEQIFEIREFEDRSDDSRYVYLRVQDHEGNELYMTPRFYAGEAVQLFELSRRLAKKLDEKIDSTFQLLSRL